MIEKVVLNGEEHKLSPDYKDIRNKPSINGIELKEGDNKIELIDIDVDPDVDIVEEGETPSVINTGTPKSPTLKFSLPKGDKGNTGNAYVPSVDESGNLSFTNTPSSELPSETPSYNIKGDRGVGLTTEVSKEGKVTTVNIKTEDNTDVKTITIEDGKDAVNPFKGYFPAGTDKPSGTFVVGDYIFAPSSDSESTDTTIWKWNPEKTGGADWEDTEVAIDAGSLAAFNSGETVAGTKIVDLYGDDGSHDIASAEGVKRFHDELLGTTIVSSEEEIINSTTYKINSLFTLRASYNELSDPLFTRPNNSTSYGLGIKVYTNNINLHGKKLKVTAPSSIAAYYIVLSNIDELDDGVFTKTGQQVYDNLQGNEHWFSSVHLDDNNQFIPYFVINAGSEKIITVPDDATYIIFVKEFRTSSSYTSNSYAPTSIKLIHETHDNGVIDDLNNNIEQVNSQIGDLSDVIDELDNTVYGEDKEVTSAADMLLRTKLVIGNNNDGISKVDTAYAYEIEVKGKSKVTITPSTEQTYYVFTEKQLPTPTGNKYSWEYVRNNCHIPSDIEGYTDPGTGSSTARLLIYPTGSENTPNGPQTFVNTSNETRYLYVQGKFGSNYPTIYTPSSIIITKTVKEGGIINSEQTSAGFNNIFLSYGKIDASTRKVANDNKYVLTNLLDCSKGIWLQLNDNYAINNVYIYDYRGELINTKEGPKYYYTSGGYFVSPIDRYSSNKCLNGYYARVEIIKRPADITSNSVEPSEVIDITDNIIKQFTYVDGEHRLSKWKYDDADKQNAFKVFTKRCKIMSNVVWKALKNVPSKYPTFWFNAGTTNSGIPYSEASEFSKYVGYHVSLRTIMTALLNPRSVMYTENIRSGYSTSKYGFTYHGIDLASAFYGTVCTGYTSYIANLQDIDVSSGWNGNGTALSTGVDNGTVIAGKKANGLYKKVGDNAISTTENDIWNIIEPMTFIWYDGHCSVISDVYKDRDNEKVFVVWTEETSAGARVYSRPLARKQFFERLDKPKWKFITFPNDNWTEPSFNTILETDTAIEAYKEYIPDNWATIGKSFTIDNDICTFAGDYPAFCINKDDDDESDSYNNYKAFLNIHRNKTYKKLEIYNEEDDETTTEAIRSVDISTNSGTYIYNSTNIDADDASDKNDWIIVDLMQLSSPLNAGKYKARVVNDDDNSNPIISGFTHFEMIEVSFAITKSSGNAICTFETKGGKPYLIRGEEQSGIMNGDRRRYIEDSDLTVGNDTYSSPQGGISLSYGGNNYVKLFVKGDYGVVVKRLPISN